MKKSLRLLFATLVMAAAVASAATSNSKSQMSSGAEPVPLCPPGVNRRAESDQAGIARQGSLVYNTTQML